jgi:hypothetical protein
MTNSVESSIKFRSVFGCDKWSTSWLLTSFAFVVSVSNIVILAKLLPSLWLLFALQAGWLVLIPTSPVLIRWVSRDESRDYTREESRDYMTSVRAASGLVFCVGAVCFLMMAFFLGSAFF